MSESQVVSTIIDDRDPSVQYFPDGTAWTVHTQVAASWQLYGNSDTFSDSQGAYIQYMFNGDTIEYWGNQGAAHGPCLVNLDGADQQTVNSYATLDGPPILLFKKGNLASGYHTIKITVVSAASPNFCELDRFVVSNTTTIGSNNNGGNNSTSNQNNNQTNSNTNSDNTSSNKSNGSKSPPWAVIGGAIGGGVVLILIAFWLWWYSQRNKPTKRVRTVRGTTNRTPIPKDTKKAIIPPPRVASDVEKAALGYGVGMGGAGVAAIQGQHGPLTPPPQQQQLFNPYDLPLARPVPPTPNSTQPLLSVHSAGAPLPHHSPAPSQASTYFSGEVRPLSQASSGFEYYQQSSQQPLQQQPQFGYPAQYTALPVWASGEALVGPGFVPVAAGGAPAPVQRAAPPPTSAPDVTTFPGFPQGKAAYSGVVQPESTLGTGGSRTTAPALHNPEDLRGGGSGSGAPPEAPPPAYDS